ncbi:MAG: pyruvate, phosphate dikinase [Alphaproteobacteria bacterium]|nr:MAG: pyruvate, phosphate dikinase [Alphaproteobacteria bacterium]
MLKTQENTNGKWVYSFGRELCEGGATQKNLLGGKGANLAEMSKIGLPVPPGFILSTEVCTHYYQNKQSYPPAIEQQVDAGLKQIEKEIGVLFGDVKKPLLLSVRSGARVSMPGMMDTILNLGLNDTTVKGLAASSNNERFAWDCYRRLIQMYSDVVLNVDHDLFEDILDTHKRRNGYRQDTDIPASGLQEIAEAYKDLVKKETGKPFPQDPREQLWGAIGAVFRSWMTPRAVTYRRINNIPEEWGTAVCVQAVVFGNMGNDCGTGVAFTRNPSTGENKFYGEYLLNAQGEDVVAGIRTPLHLEDLQKEMPEVYKELDAIRLQLEKHYKEMQDIEFTIQNKKLYMLQTRTGKRTAAAALKIAVDMVSEKLITKEQAIRRINPQSLDQLLHPTIDAAADKTVLAKGLPASPGAATGEIVFDSDDAEKLAKDGKKIILCRTETSPEDIHGMHAAQGILTSRGGMTSHAAVVARGMGKPCVSGAGDVMIDYKNKIMNIKGRILKEGEKITIDGSTGEVLLGAVRMLQPVLTGDFSTLMVWADAARRLKVRANAETAHDAENARKFGAEGIGLCRTEHMFFEPSRILYVRQMILAETQEERRAALAKIEPHQREDFIHLFKIMKGLPVTIRLLDPPLHEFLPHEDEEIASLAKALSLTPEKVKQRVDRLHEANPMLGLRGSRLGIVYPEIYETQVRAIFEAALAVKKETGETVIPEIMVPLIATKAEMDILKAMIDKIAAAAGFKGYLTGTMIELPRAALAAGSIAETAEFFSFGTNDLTQTTFGISRDDAGSFLPAYQSQGILPADPFASIDVDGVGELVKTAVERGRKTRKELKLGICGEHGGDPASIKFFESVGLDYISCSPYRVPIARLAAAQAALKE